MSNSPLVSIVMPAYNAEKYIINCIKSVLNQTYSNFEFIIVDDGSVDRTAQLAKEFVDPRIIFIAMDKNRGISAASNKGIAIAKGEYIAKMDADDDWMDNKLQLQVDFMQQNPEVGVLGTAVFSVKDGKKGLLSTAPIQHNDCMCALLATACFYHSVVLIRKSALGSNRYNEDYLSAEDYRLWVDLAKKGVVFANLATPLMHYNRHDNSNSFLRQQEMLGIIDKISKEFIEYNFGTSTWAAFGNKTPWLCGFSNRLFAFRQILKNKYPLIKKLVNLKNKIKDIGLHR